MTTGTLTLTDFLLARIAEDEARARAMQSSYRRVVAWGWFDPDFGDFHPEEDWTDEGAPHDPARVLAECEAKRRIVFICASALGPFDGDINDWPDMSAAENAALRRGQAQAIHANLPRVLRLLALPYADHPDYRDEWRP